MTRARKPFGRCRSWAMIALVGLSACANPRADDALFAQQVLIGMAKPTLLSCAGVPNRATSIDNRDYYTFVAIRQVSTPAATAGPYRWGDRGPIWPGYGFPFFQHDDFYYDSRVEQLRCEATVTLHNGVVEQLVYRSGSDLGACYDIVAACLATIPGRVGAAPAATR
ncbi:MAG: hypothetical protein GC191_21160 [Azospirillum sp.]|nr:hypothetical protein [Azospirillum sp.]